MHWKRSGIPRSPTAWLIKVAMNKSIDTLRLTGRETQKIQELSLILPVYDEDIEEIPDERLRLIFTCCHPALDEKSRVALTLRTVCNLTTVEIAEAFLDAVPTMGQRLSRVKVKIKAKGISFSVPPEEQWPERLDAVLSTIYLIFTTGYIADEMGSRDLCQEALFLIRLLNSLKPEDSEIKCGIASKAWTFFK